MACFTQILKTHQLILEQKLISNPCKKGCKTNQSIAVRKLTLLGSKMQYDRWLKTLKWLKDSHTTQIKDTQSQFPISPLVQTIVLDDFKESGVSDSIDIQMDSNKF